MSQNENKPDTYEHDVEAFIEDKPLQVDPRVDLSDARFVPLHTFGSPAEAEMVNDILRQNNLRSAVQSGSDDAFSALFSVTTLGAIVLVDERDLERAREIYEAFFGGDTTPLTGEITPPEQGA